MKERPSKDLRTGNFVHRIYVYIYNDIFYRFAFKRGDPVPKFHYETRAFRNISILCQDHIYLLSELILLAAPVWLLCDFKNYNSDPDPTF